MLTHHRPGGEGRGQPRSQGLFPGLGRPQSQGKGPGNEVGKRRAALILDFGRYEALIRRFTVHISYRFVFHF